MFPVTPGNTQVYSPFGSYVVEQRSDGPRHLGPETAEPPAPETSPGATGLEVIAAPPKPSAPLSPQQAAIGLRLQNYYQFACAGSTPARFGMLLNELEHKAEAKSRRAA